MTSDLPSDIDLESLPGPRRGKHPALYVRDEAVWAPGRAHVAVAYTIHEASMGNEVGLLLWARMENGKATILGNPSNLLISCWRSPWCRWLDAETFVFKTQYFHRARTRTPLVVLHVRNEFAVVQGTDAPDVWLDRDIPRDLDFDRLTACTFRRALERAT